MKSVCLIQGHPHPTNRHFCHAIAQSYADGARSAGAKIRRIDIGAMDVPLLRDPADFLKPPPAAVLSAQDAVMASDHLVVIYPLWLGTMPALVKAFFEQLSRNSFAMAQSPKGGWPQQKLKGKSARVIVTMGMPAAAYKLMFGADGVRGFESGILEMAGIKPIRETLIGGVGDLSRAKAEAILARMRRLGSDLA